LVRAASAGAVVIAAALPLAVAGTAGASTTPATLSGASLSALSANEGVTAVFGAGALYATSVTLNNGFTLTPGTPSGGLADVTTAANFTAGTTLTEFQPTAITTGTYTAGTDAAGTTVTLSTNPGAAIYPGETVSVNGVNDVVATSAVTASTGTTFTVATALTPNLTGKAFSAAGSQTVFDFSAVTLHASAAAGDTLNLQSAVYNTSFTGYAQFGEGASGTMYIYGTGFSYNGSSITVTSNAPGMTFTNSSATEVQLNSASGFGYVSVPFSTTSATAPTFYTVTVTDGNGTTAALSNAIVVNAPPTVTSISPNTLPQGATGSVTVSGSNFVTGTTLTLTASDGTTVPAKVTSVSSGTTLIASVQAVNSVSGAATPGAYSATVTNPDGGTSTTANAFTISGYGISSVNPGWIEGNGTAQSVPVTISGTDFTPGGVLAMTQTGSLGVSLSPVYTVTASSISATILVPSSVTNTSTPEYLGFTFTNTSGITTSVSDAVGINQSSTLAGNAPTLTSVGTVATLSAGSVQNLVLTGTNFAPGMTVQFYSAGTTHPAESAGVCSSASVVSSTTATCAITVGSTWTAGSDDAYVTTGAGQSGALANAITVAGPVITSASPSVLGVGTSGTVTLTGTGFTSTMTLGGSTSSTVGTLTYVSATQATVVVTNATAITTIQLSGSGVLSPAFQMTAGAPVTASGVIYGVTGVSGVGLGATAFPVTFTGSGFLPGASVTLPAASGATVTVSSVSPASITATVTVASTGTAANYAFTVTNSNGGQGTSAGTPFTVDPAPLNSKSTFNQTSVVAGATAATITVGTGFLSATTKVSASSPLLTLGTPSYNSSTATLSFTASAPAITGTTAVGLTLTFANVDGGTSTQSFSVNPQPTVTGTYYVPTFSTNYEVSVAGTGFEPGITATSSNSAFSVLVAGVNSTGTVVTLLVSTTAAATTGTSSNVTLTNTDGSTVTFALNGGSAPVVKPPVAFKVFRVFGVTYVGKTVTIKISGSGFYGQPKVTSNVAGVRAVVSGDNGKVLTVRVTVAPTSPRGVHTFTVTLANGKSGMINYNQK